MASDAFLCRACGSESISSVLSLGMIPIADALVTPEHLGDPEICAQLDLVRCHTCSLVQITQALSPEILFRREYPYYSSYSSSGVEHFRFSAEEIIRSRRLDENSMVIEAASNDGYMLQHFLASNIPVLGIDPAEGPIAVARKRGIRCECDFFGKDLAARLLEQGTQADVFLANNVLAHVADLNGFVEGIGLLLRTSGIAVIEVPYVRDLIDNCEFDTIHHQHMSYFSVTSLDKLFRPHGLFLNKVKQIPTHGGSLRLFVEKREDVDNSVQQLLLEEMEAGLNHSNYYRRFAARVHRVREKLVSLVTGLRNAHNRLIGYGANAKATVLLAFCGLEPSAIEYIVDLNVVKQGKFMPVTHIPICEPERLLRDMPDYVIIFAWNLSTEILDEQREFRARGGRFIMPIPEPQVL